MRFVEVSSSKDVKEFLKLPDKLYKSSKHWVKPWSRDIEEVFDQKKNKFFRHGECTRWLLLDNSNKTIGRIAAFINRRTMKEKNSLDQQLIVGGMGFFECIDDQETAFALFDKAKEWLQERNCNVMEGPINFGERDAWWGLLAEGFDRDPNYRMPYTHPYYLPFFENYGFQIYFKQLTFGRGVSEKLKPKYQEKADRLMRDPNYHFSYLELKELDKFTEDFRTIYNKAWANHGGVKGMSEVQARAVMKQIKPIMDPKVIYFAYYDKDPIGFFIIIPEINQILKRLHGNLFTPKGILLYLYYKLFNRFNKIVGRGFGIIPEHQGKGVEGAIVNYSADVVHHQIKRRYKTFEMNWIGDFNKPMIKLCSDVGDVVKTHHTYRKMLDSNIHFERCKDIN